VWSATNGSKLGNKSFTKSESLNSGVKNFIIVETNKKKSLWRQSTQKKKGEITAGWVDRVGERDQGDKGFKKQESNEP